MMKIGAVMFFTAYSMSPAALGRALEERGFESLWVPEHSHIPLSRKTSYRMGGRLIRPYYDIMDPFPVLNTAAAATTKLKIGTGVCLINQRDPIQTAKLVSSIDQLSNVRFLVRSWKRLEPGRDGKSRYRLCHSSQAVPGTHRGDASDLDSR